MLRGGKPSAQELFSLRAPRALGRACVALPVRGNSLRLSCGLRCCPALLYRLSISPPSSSFAPGSVRPAKVCMDGGVGPYLILFAIFPACWAFPEITPKVSLAITQCLGHTDALELRSCRCLLALSSFLLLEFKPTTDLTHLCVQNLCVEQLSRN